MGSLVRHEYWARLLLGMLTANKASYFPQLEYAFTYSVPLAACEKPFLPASRQLSVHIATIHLLLNKPGGGVAANANM